MTTKFHIVLPVSALAYTAVRGNVLDWQSDRDYVNENQPKDIGGNRFALGYSAFFEDFGGLDMEVEPCKAILPDVYDWLMENAPNALIEVGEYDLDYDSEVYADDPDMLDELVFDDEEEATSGSADVYLNFGQDRAGAMAFKLMFV